MTKLTIQKDKTKQITPDLIGLFFEDINCAADGGLYAEMLENRSFEAINSQGVPRNYVLSEDSLYAWSLIAEGEGKMEISINAPLCEKNPHYLRFTAKKAGQGFENKAYDGLCLKKGASYKVSLYAKEVDYPEGNLILRLAKDGANYGEASVTLHHVVPCEDGYQVMLGNCESKIWRRYEAVITATESVKGAYFQVILDAAGSLEFDLISMMPMDAVDGVFRKDLLEALQGLKPGFLRFPGGCIVEGTSISRRYLWKDTVGPIEQRKINTNLWALTGGNVQRGWQTEDSHYMQSYGIGFYEYFRLCELLSSDLRRCEPLPVVNLGIACQFRSYDTVAVGTPEFQEYVQDVLDLIEFANGDVTTKWGALRASMGHPESFNLHMVALGNEQWESENVDLGVRYRIFEKAVHDAYPDILCLGTAGPFHGNSTYEDAWKYYRDEAKVNPKFAYAVDEHYYVAPQWLYEKVNMYDTYPRDVAVFAGEYAAHDGNLSNSMEGALAEAAMLTGIERNSDLVILASYAPLFNRIGHSQWTPDMIWFDEDSVVLTPTYEVQKLFSQYAGDTAIEIPELLALQEEKIYASAVSRNGKVILKVVNANEEARTIELPGVAAAEVSLHTLTTKEGLPRKNDPSAAITTEGGDKSMPVEKMSDREVCTYRAPEGYKVCDSTAKVSEGIVLPAMSFTVIEL